MHPNFSEKLTVAMIGFFAFLQVYSVQAILPVLIEHLHANEIQVGIVVGATVLAIALMSPFVGMLSDMFGRKCFIVGSLIMLSIPTALIGVGQSIQTLSAYRFLQGLTIPGITVVLIAYIGEEYQPHIAKMMSLYVAGTVLGGFSGRFFVGHLHELIGWRWSYGIMALLTMFGAIWVYLTLPESKNFHKNTTFGTAMTILILHSKNSHVISACLLGGCVLFSLVGCFSFITLHLAQAPYFLDSSYLANIFALYLIGMVITPLSARLSARFGTTKTIIFAIICSMIGLLLTLSPPLCWVIIGLILMSSGVFVTQSSTISYIASHVTQGRSLASGLYYMGYYGGGSIGAWLCGVAYSYGQWQFTVIMIGVVQLLVVLIAGVLMYQHSDNLS